MLSQANCTDILVLIFATGCGNGIHNFPKLPMTREIHTDITIIGGGIAGLWLLNRLRYLGYNAVLVEKNQLGSQQTIASQGMIHGGIKYTLAGTLSNSSEAIAAMPGIWRQCVAGKSQPNLLSTRILSENYYMWSGSSLGSRLTSFFGSKALRGRVTKLGREAYPACFDHPAFTGSLYELGDLVLDVESLISELVKPCTRYIFKSKLENQQLLNTTRAGRLDGVNLAEDLTIRSSRYIFAAGAGNRELLHQCNIGSPAMQVRPLHQVLVKHKYAHPVYAHCVSGKSGSKPRMTITSHPTRDGQWIWYIGGNLAETGVERSADSQISFAASELSETLPWIDLGEAQWRTLRIDRAEPEQTSSLRPDNPFVESIGNITVVWPIKLTLAPAASDLVETILKQEGMRVSTTHEDMEIGLELDKPRIAEPVWDRLFLDQGESGS